MSIQHERTIRRALYNIVITALFALLLVLISTGMILKPLASAILARGPHFTSYFEIVFVGLVPVILMLIFREAPARYGIKKNGIGRSLVLGSLLGLAYWLISPLIAHTGVVHDLHGFGLAFPANALYALLGLFAYGPLEAFFVIYLIENVDRLAAAGREPIPGTPLSAGMVAVPAVFGLMHAATTGNWSNAAQVAVFSCGYGAIYRYTGCAFGPMLAWTLANTWIHFLLVGCLS